MAEDVVLNIVMLSPERVIYEGKAARALIPGERGVFEILPHHKKILSRLLEGYVVIDQTAYPVKRGVVKVAMNNVTIIVEE